MNPIELRPAYAWTCDDCGALNFTEGIVVEADSDTMRELREDHGIQPWEDGDFIQMPETVKCRRCGEVYSTIHFRDGKDSLPPSNP